jgi:hypothetical protein
VSASPRVVGELTRVTWSTEHPFNQAGVLCDRREPPVGATRPVWLLDGEGPVLSPPLGEQVLEQEARPLAEGLAGEELGHEGRHVVEGSKVQSFKEQTQVIGVTLTTASMPRCTG